MKLFIANRYSRICKRITSVVATLSVFMTFGNPQLVVADNNAVYDEGSVVVEEDEPPLRFPVAKDKSPKYSVWVLATGYSLERAQTDDTPCIPANGENLCELREEQGYHNTVAANFMRFGKQVRIPEYYGKKDFIVRDRMNSRYNGEMRIDLVFDSRDEAREWGARWVMMDVY